MVDRRILILGSCKGPEDTFTPQRVNGLMQRLSRVLGPESVYGFSSIATKGQPPELLYNPLRSGVVTLLENLTDTTPETELLICFIGHSKTLGSSGLELYLGNKTNGDPSYLTADELLHETKKAGFKKVYLVIDGCHASNCVAAVNAAALDIFAIYSSHGWAYNGNFTEALIRTLELRTQRNDQRIDRRRGGITFQKVFEASRANLRAMLAKGGIPSQEPGAVGNQANELLLSTPPLLTDRFNPFASSQSMYGRLKTVLSIIERDEPDDAQLIVACQKAGGFLLRRGEKGGPSSFVSKVRFLDYTDFLIAAKFVVKAGGTYKATEEGKLALDLEQFNRRLLDAIEANILPSGLNYDVLEDVIKQLLDDLIPPTPSKIEQRLQLTASSPIKITPRLRFAFQILPATGRFLKGSADALFLAEI